MAKALTIRESWTITLQQSLLRAIDNVTAKLGRTPAVPAHLATGLRGEEEALFYLRRLGYIIIARQWRSVKMRGDIDLIGWDGKTLCFIEVKTRTRRDWAPAESAVDEEKKRMLRRMARAYLRRCDDADTLQIRFDVVSVYITESGVECELMKDWFPREA